MKRIDTRVLPRLTAALFAAVLAATASPASAGDGWRTLTPPQPMPAPESTGSVDVNGASIFYALYGSGNAEAVLLLHGGLGAGEDFGGQVAALAEKYKVVAIDSRGHGRSTDDDQPYGYNLMAGDVMGVMDSLGISKAAVVGWSDGGNIGLDMAINNSGRLTKLFALGANYQTTGVRPSVFNDTLIHAFVGHAAAQYASISPTPDAFEAFSGRVFEMWGTQPAFSDEQLGSITTPTVIAVGVYEEAIDETHSKSLVALIPGATLLLIDNASHFAHWQQVEAVNTAILEFLAGG